MGWTTWCSCMRLLGRQWRLTADEGHRVSGIQPWRTGKRARVAGKPPTDPKAVKSSCVRLRPPWRFWLMADDDPGGMPAWVARGRRGPSHGSTVVYKNEATFRAFSKMNRPRGDRGFYIPSAAESRSTVLPGRHRRPVACGPKRPPGAIALGADASRRRRKAVAGPLTRLRWTVRNRGGNRHALGR
jgi:hypothetical protein